MKTRLAAAVLTCALLLGGAEIATGAWKTGNYAGTTTQGKSIKFKVTKSKVKSLSGAFRSDCGYNASFSGLSGKLSSRGKFSASERIGAGGKLVVKGKVKGKRANGTLRFTYYDCDSGVVKWEAKRS